LLPLKFATVFLAFCSKGAICAVILDDMCIDYYSSFHGKTGRKSSIFGKKLRPLRSEFRASAAGVQATEIKPSVPQRRAASRAKIAQFADVHVFGFPQ
jgi:hypothetical protein